MGGEAPRPEEGACVLLGHRLATARARACASTRIACAPQAPSKARAAGGGGGSATAMGDMFFTMMDKDKDGQLSKEEVGKLAEMMAAMPGGPPAIPP